MKLHITLNPADDCNRGCTHCMSRSIPNKGTRFSDDLMDALVEEIERLNISSLKFTFTGGGEPFRNPLISSLVDKLFCRLGKNLARVNIVTSGFLPTDHAEIDQFKKILEKPYSGFIKILLSFNLFNETFSERLVNTLSLIMRHRSRVGWTFIRLCLSCEKFGASYASLESALGKFEEQTYSKLTPLIVIMPDSDMAFAKSFFLPYRKRMRIKEPGKRARYEWEWEQQRWSEEQEVIMTQESELYELLMLNENDLFGRMPIIVDPFSFEKFGRGKKLNQSPLGDSACRAIHPRFENNKARIVVGADGRFFPSMECCGSDEMSFGKLGQDSLKTALDRKATFFSHAFRHILADKRIFDQDDGMCEICKNVRYSKFF